MLPDSLSPPGSWDQHGVGAKCVPMARGHSSEGLDSPGNASPDEPWEGRRTSMADNSWQRNKNFFDPAQAMFAKIGWRFSGAGGTRQGGMGSDCQRVGLDGIL